MYFPNAASGDEWNRMATLSIRFYSLHPWVHCVLYKFVVFEIFVVEKPSFSTTNKANNSNLPCGEKMYFPNAASGDEWNRMATLSIRFYSLHPWVHCVLYKFVVFEIFVVEKHFRTFSSA